MGDPVLRTPAAPVVDFDAELRTLIGDLTETMFAAGGAGLAAPQLGVGLRVFTWYVDGEIGHLVNPDVVPVGEETEEGPEGCLSIPGYRWDCRRHLHVVASGWNMFGDPVRVEGSELLARAIQHETDHLVVGGQQRLERGNGGRRRTGEQEPQCGLTFTTGSGAGR
jgi:peptide deformylase